MNIVAMFLVLLSTSFNNEYDGMAGPNSIQKNGMDIKWYHSNHRIFIEMSAPTNGWVAIGFNTTASTTNTYLIMGNVINERPNVVEYFTESPGNYNPITSYGQPTSVQHITGEQSGNITKLKFSLPIKPQNKYQRELSTDLEYTLLLAYSREDDFKHHSMMRTSIKIIL